jgi:hypothetical protein
MDSVPVVPSCRAAGDLNIHVLSDTGSQVQPARLPDIIASVGRGGLEPPGVSPLAPKASAFTSFATCPIEESLNGDGGQVCQFQHRDAGGQVCDRHQRGKKIQTFARKFKAG